MSIYTKTACVLAVAMGFGVMACNKKAAECEKFVTATNVIDEKYDKNKGDKPEDAEERAAILEKGVTDLKAIPVTDEKLKTMLTAWSDNDGKLAKANRDHAAAIRKADAEETAKQAESMKTLLAADKKAGEELVAYCKH